ncbi:hypothetical protein LMG29542_02949 [Paraburkholderia humisilvae]|uniref:Uncharacterized protein n=2 Tax=Paraburkholderia humisilvae TaxID=627669 RepID=A0A6J5DVF3_9BURK|nr:hypothetical protein LMG29542_02949 [Paraburkholderia humisilvae]
MRLPGVARGTGWPVGTMAQVMKSGEIKAMYDTMKKLYANPNDKAFE